MDAFWSGDQQGGFTEGLLLRSSGRLIKGWVWGVHPQLRNGLGVSPLNPCLFYLNQQTELVTLNIATGQRTTVWPKESLETQPEITCFSIIDKYVVIGTGDGQLVVRDIVKGHQKLLNRALAPFSRMVNAIVGYHCGDERRIVVCSNNYSVRVFKFPELTSVSDIDLQRTSNFAALSPDNQWMVVVGDRTELYVLKAGETEFHLKHIVPFVGEEFQDGNGANMVWWEPHPPYRFAVASEAGATLVFAHPGDEDWSPKPLYYLWSRNVDPWTHAVSYPIPDISWSNKQPLAYDAKMASARFITTSSATEQGSSLLVACSAGQHIYVYDLERRLRQSIELKSLPCVAMRSSLSASASASPVAVPGSTSPALTGSLSGGNGEEERESKSEDGDVEGEEAAMDTDGDNADAQVMEENEEDMEGMEITGLVVSADGSKLYVSFESAPDTPDGYIVELVVNKLASLRSQCTRFVQQNMNQWRGFDWERHLPATLLSEIFSPYKFS